MNIYSMQKSARLTDSARKYLSEAKAEGIVPQDETEQTLVDVVLEQEIVSWSTCTGSISFDIDDIEWD